MRKRSGCVLDRDNGSDKSASIRSKIIIMFIIHINCKTTECKTEKTRAVVLQLECELLTTEIILYHNYTNLKLFYLI